MRYYVKVVKDGCWITDDIKMFSTLTEAKAYKAKFKHHSFEITIFEVELTEVTE